MSQLKPPPHQVRPARKPASADSSELEYEDDPYAQPAAPLAPAIPRAAAGTTENRVIFALVGGVVLGGLMVFLLGKYRIVAAEEYMGGGRGPGAGNVVTGSPIPIYSSPAGSHVATPPPGGNGSQAGPPPGSNQGASPQGSQQGGPPPGGQAQGSDPQGQGRDHFPTGELKPGKQNIDYTGSYFLGPENAAHTLAIYSDFECPACGQWAEGLKPTIETYKDRLKVVFKHLPLPMHPKAKGAAIAAEAAGRQGKFWEMHDLLFQNNTSLGPDLYAQLAGQLSLDLARFKKDQTEKELSDKVMRDFKEGERARVHGTPSFFVDGQLADVGHPSQLETLLANLFGGGGG